MKLNHLRDIVAVAEHGSLRAAARHLNIAQPAITRSIREVEESLGTALFERRSTGVVPTAIGQRYLVRAAAMLRDMQSARDEVEQLLEGGGGQVSVGLSTVPHLALLPKALAPFKQRFTDARLTIVEGLLPRMQLQLERGELDFYIGPLTERALAKNLEAELLFENLRLVFCRKGHPLSDATQLADLTEARWISTSVTESHDAELAPLFARHGLPAPRIDLHAQSGLTMLLAAAHSDLLTLLPQQFLLHPMVQQSLHCIAVRETLAAPSIYVVRRAGVLLTPAAQHFQDLLCKAARQLLKP